MAIALAKIRTDGGTQSRAVIDEATVAEYAEAMKEPATVFPPCIVYHDGRDYWLADGFHRVAAWKRIGRVEVPADVRQGDRRRAVLHSCGANAVHGLRRTNADKRRAVMTLLEDEEWSQWSHRQIARQCGVSHTSVQRMREEVSGTKCQINTRTVQRGGTTYQQDTSRIGKPERQPDVPPAPAERPEAQPETADRQPQPNLPQVIPEPPDPNARLRAIFRRMSPEAQENDWIMLNRDMDELRITIGNLKRANAKLQAKIDKMTDRKATA